MILSYSMQQERDGRVCQVDYNPDRPVHTAWDLGVGDDMSLWFFQVRPDGVDIIDHYSAHGYAIGHYVDIKKEKGYIYGDDWVPHDAKVRDILAKTARKMSPRGLAAAARLSLDPRLSRLLGEALAVSAS